MTAYPPSVLTDIVNTAINFPAWKVTLTRTFFSSFLAGSLRADFYLEMAAHFDRGDGMIDALITEYVNETDEGTREAGFFSPITSPLLIAIPCILHTMVFDDKHWTSAISPWLATAESLVLSASSESGDLAKAFRDHSESAESMSTALSGLVEKSSRILLMFLGVVVGLYALSIWYFPQYFRSMPRKTLPPDLETLKNISDFTADWGILIIFVSLIIPIVIVYSFPRFIGPWRARIDNIYPYTLYRDWTILSWLRSTGYLFAAGGGVHEVLTAQLNVASPYLAERLETAMAYDDKPLGDAFALSPLNWPPQRLIRKIKKHVATEQPGKSLLHLANKEEKRILRALTATTSLINNVSVIAISIFLGWLLYTTSLL